MEMFRRATELRLRGYSCCDLGRYWPHFSKLLKKYLVFLKNLLLILFVLLQGPYS